MDYHLLSHKKKWTKDRHHNRDKAHKNYTELKKPDKARVHTRWVHVYKIPENAKYSNRKQISDCLGHEVGHKEAFVGDGYVH